MGVSGILIPEVWKRGTEGKISHHLHEKITFHFWVFVLECKWQSLSCKSKLNIKKATSEFGPSKASVVGLMSEWMKNGKKIKGTDKDLKAQ